MARMWVASVPGGSDGTGTVEYANEGWVTLNLSLRAPPNARYNTNTQGCRFQKWDTLAIFMRGSICTISMVYCTITLMQLKAFGDLVKVFSIHYKAFFDS